MSGGVPRIASVVEGHGEVPAIPELVRRVAQEFYERYVEVPQPHRVPKANMVKGPDLARAVRLQAGRVAGRGGVLVLTDADDDEPNALRESLQATVNESASGSATVVVAVKEYEAWFLAGIASLRGHRSVRDDARFDDDPEARRNCKKLLEEQMTESYSETRHQVAFSSLLDLSAVAQASPSFRSLVDAVGGILEEAHV